jgi:SNF2 family DNA or RNA helicase
MLVVHGIWARGEFHLWAEDAGLLAAPAPGPGGRRTARPHPFACPALALAGACAGLAAPAAEIAGKFAHGELTLWLPATRTGPACSPELTPPPRRAGRLALTPWRVPALTAGPAAALDLLTSLGEASAPGFANRYPGEAREIGAPGGSAGPGSTGSEPDAVVPGGSLRYFCAVAALAGDLVALGRVLPALASEDGGYHARWRPVLSGVHAQRARELAGAMPPVCRATTADGEPAALVFYPAFGALADAAVRARLSPDGQAPSALLAPRRGRRPARIEVAERWAGSLSGTAARVHIDHADPADNAAAVALAASLDAWLDAAQAPAGPVRTCFRLTEPDYPAPAGSSAGAHAATPDPAGPAGAGQIGAADGVAGTRDGASGGSAATAGGEADELPWRVEFLLQASDDPSLVLPAAQIWTGQASGWPGASALRHPEEELLAGLGRAARLFPELDAELRGAAPAAAVLDRAAALRFLSQTAPLLQAAGFGVLLPAWTRKSRLGLRLTTRSRSGKANRSAATFGFGLAELVDFRYDLAIGDQVLDPDELDELARMKVPLVRLRGQWVELDQRQLQAALRFMQRRGRGTMSAADALLAAVGADSDSQDLPVTGVDADGWLGDLLSGEADRRLTPVATPESFRGTLRPYQQRGLAWLTFCGSLGIGAVLADDMGLGKTVQLLALLDAERERARAAAAGEAAAGAAAPHEAGRRTTVAAHRNPPDGPAAGGVTAHEAVEVIKPTLLVCPMSLAGNWQREAARFTPHLNVHVHHGSGRLSGAELAAGFAAADLVITTYGLAARDVEALAAVAWQRVVCDEAQNIKNAATRQARAVRSLPARARVALTGTPVENRLAELWSIMEFTNPGLLGATAVFHRRYAVPIERHGDEQAAAALKRLTGPFILRRLKTDRSVIADLPDKLEMKVWCNLTAEQASLYQATVAEMLARIDAAQEGIERRGLVLATMAKLKQVCNHPAHLLGDGSALAGRSGKLARLEEICDEVLAEGERALCFTQYAEFGAMLEPYLAARLGCPVFYLHGGTSKRQRDALVARFQEAAEPAIFVLSLKAGGTGLNLTAANHVIHVDRWWNPAVEDQATDRAFRIGQRKNVQVRKFICVGTMEERIDAMIEQKKALAERIVGTGEGWLTEMSLAQLREVISLSPEAVSQ